jgi:hypothetical protein
VAIPTVQAQFVRPPPPFAGPCVTHRTGGTETRGEGLKLAAFCLLLSVFCLLLSAFWFLLPAFCFLLPGRGELALI